jgi:hypothetical protein
MGSRRKVSSFLSGAPAGVALDPAPAVDGGAVAEVVDVAGAAAGTAFPAVLAGILAEDGFLDDEGFALAGSAALRDSTPLQLRTTQTRTLFIPAYLGSPPPYFNPKTSSLAVLFEVWSALSCLTVSG